LLPHPTAKQESTMTTIPMTLPPGEPDDLAGTAADTGAADPRIPDWEPLADARTRTLDALAGFDKMAEHAEPTFAPIVEAFRDLHRRHGEEMTRILSDAHHAPEDGGSMMGTVNRLVVATRALFDDIDADVLDQIHSGEEHVVQAYRGALSAHVPQHVTDKVSRMLDELNDLLADTRPVE
jgi:uncharacterized protein (TIGR02284 family)